MSLRKELHKLYKHQKEIMLVYRPTEKSSWADRCLYLKDDSGYSPIKPYNHRSILDCEIVLEYDEGSPEDNERYANKACEHLRRDGIKYSKWFSGGKSTHVHILVDMGSASNRKLLKRSFLKHYGTFYEHPDSKYLYTEDTKPDSLDKSHRVMPDLQLDGENHLIRAEYGVHERTQENKRNTGRSPGYSSELSTIPQVVWDKYIRQYKINIKRRTTIDIKDVLEHPGVKMILDSNTFREIGDGRARALYHLICILKNKYSRDELVDKLVDWYRYSTKRKEKLSRREIEYHVDHNIRKGYVFSIIKFNDFLEELGREDLIVDQNQ